MKQVSPEVSVTLSNGTTVLSNPTLEFFYDLEGRLIGTQDAKGNKNSRIYNNAGNLTKEIDADGALRIYEYDALGNNTGLRLGGGRRTNYIYDKNNQIIQTQQQVSAGTVSLTRPSDFYEFNERGQQIAHTNGRGYRQTTDYDYQGRVLSNTSLAGDVLNYDYDYNASSGETTSRTTNVFGKSTTDQYDAAGNLVKHIDLGGRTTFYNYNNKGELFTQGYNFTGTVGGVDTPQSQRINFTYNLDGSVNSIEDVTSGTFTQYKYDLNGNRIFEGYALDTAKGKVYLQSSSATYDALNRVTSITDPDFKIQYKYDANGNRLNIDTQYFGNVNSAQSKQNYWYDYDSLDRIVVAKGELINGSIQARSGTEAVSIGYNQNGQRSSANNETYIYDSYGRLFDVRITDETTNVDSLRARRFYDDAGNVETSLVYDSQGAVVEAITYTYTKDNQIQTRDSGGGKKEYYSYFATGTLQRVWRPDSNSNTLSNYNYELWDSYKQSAIKITGTVTAYNAADRWQPGVSKFTYDVNGHLSKVEDVEGRRSLNYTLDQAGRILQRVELAGAVGSVGADSIRSQRFYYFNGQGVGDAGDWGLDEKSYGTILASRNNVSQNTNQAVTSIDFDYGYSPLTDANPGLNSSQYTVQEGDTLESIALAIWGDSSLWYLIADVNGASNGGLTTGQVLQIPNVLNNVRNNADTFRPYDPGLLLGDVNPTLPDAPPPPKPKCSAQQIIVIVVAVAITAYLGPIAGEFFAGTVSLGAVIGGAIGAGIGAAVGSYASQVVAKEFGLIEDIDKGSIRDAFKIGAITAGLKLLGEANNFTGLIGGGIDQAILSEAISASVIDDYEFNWHNVAAAVITAPINNAVGDGINDALSGTGFAQATGAFGVRAITSLATGSISSIASYRLNHRKEAYRPNVNSILGNAIGAGIKAQILQKPVTQAPVTVSAEADGNANRNPSRNPGAASATPGNIPGNRRAAPGAAGLPETVSSQDTELSGTGLSGTDQVVDEQGKVIFKRGPNGEAIFFIGGGSTDGSSIAGASNGVSNSTEDKNIFDRLSDGTKFLTAVDKFKTAAIKLSDAEDISSRIKTVSKFNDISSVRTLETLKGREKDIRNSVERGANIFGSIKDDFSPVKAGGRINLPGVLRIGTAIFEVGSLVSDLVNDDINGNQAVGKIGSVVVKTAVVATATAALTGTLIAAGTVAGAPLLAVAAAGIVISYGVISAYDYFTNDGASVENSITSFSNSVFDF